ncbi:MAG: type II toxin-antitoxin system Phd/YefM family antitoxin [Burkholderiales bacterium]
MEQQYSIAQARDQLPGIVHEVEKGKTVTLTRRGKPVARLVSVREYDRLTGEKRAVAWDAASVDTRGFGFDRDEANAR